MKRRICPHCSPSMPGKVSDDSMSCSTYHTASQIHHDIPMDGYIIWPFIVMFSLGTHCANDTVPRSWRVAWTSARRMWCWIRSAVGESLRQERRVGGNLGGFIMLPMLLDFEKQKIIFNYFSIVFQCSSSRLYHVFHCFSTLFPKIFGLCLHGGLGWWFGSLEKRGFCKKID